MSTQNGISIYGKISARACTRVGGILILRCTLNIQVAILYAIGCEFGVQDLGRCGHICHLKLLDMVRLPSVCDTTI